MSSFKNVQQQKKSSQSSPAPLPGSQEHPPASTPGVTMGDIEAQLKHANQFGHHIAQIAPLPPEDPVDILHTLVNTIMPAEANHAEVRRIAQEGAQTPAMPLPFSDRIQQSFGSHDISQIQAHVGPQATTINAHAYTMGEHIVFARNPNLYTAAHEAAHVIQQRGSISLPGNIGAIGDIYEQQANSIARRVLAGQSAEAHLDRFVETTTGNYDGEHTSGSQRSPLSSRSKLQFLSDERRGELMKTLLQIRASLTKTEFKDDAPLAGIWKKLKAISQELTSDPEKEPEKDKEIAALLEELRHVLFDERQQFGTIKTQETGGIEDTQEPISGKKVLAIKTGITVKQQKIAPNDDPLSVVKSISNVISHSFKGGKVDVENARFVQFVCSRLWYKTKDGKLDTYPGEVNVEGRDKSVKLSSASQLIWYVDAAGSSPFYDGGERMYKRTATNLTVFDSPHTSLSTIQDFQMDLYYDKVEPVYFKSDIQFVTVLVQFAPDKDYFIPTYATFWSLETDIPVHSSGDLEPKAPQYTIATQGTPQNWAPWQIGLLRDYKDAGKLFGFK